MDISGRFLTEDPLGLAAGDPNIYRYGNNNPVSAADPSGLGQRATKPLGNGVPYVTGGMLDTINRELAHEHMVFDKPVVVPGYNDGKPVDNVGFGADGNLFHYDQSDPKQKKEYDQLKRRGRTYDDQTMAEAIGNTKRKPYSADPFPNQDNCQTFLDRADREYEKREAAHATSNVVAPRDPNDKIGPGGSGDVRFVSVGSPAQYTINFENVSTATAPASVVTITDQLDSDLDWRTLRLGEIAFGGHAIAVPEGRSFYSTTVDLRPEGTNLLVRIDAGIDPVSGIVRWTFVSIDPATGEPSKVAGLGFLPPNDANNSGQGHVTYTVRPKADRATGTVITNSATIVFDTEEPIETNATSNVVDAGVPTSSVTPLAATTNEETFTVIWSGVDDAQGSGLASYDVYVSKDGGAYQLWQPATSDGSATYTAQQGDHTYRFYTRARDNAGNVEAAPASPDATIRVDLVPPTVTVDLAPTSDTGVPGDRRTNDRTPTFAGVTESLAIVTIDVTGPGGYHLVGTTQADADGQWAYTVEDANALGGGTHQVSVSATDQAGNISAEPAALTLEVDLSCPVVTAASVGNGGTQGEVASLSFTFSEDVSASLTVGSLTIRDQATGALLNISGAQLSYNAVTNVATWDLSAVAFTNGDYAATLSGSTASDVAGNRLDGNGDGQGGDDYAYAFSRQVGGYQDVTSQMGITYGRSSYDRRTGEYSYPVSIKNTGTTAYSGPVRLVISGLNQPSITLRNATGMTEDGRFYIELAPSGGVFDPNEVIGVTLRFLNPLGLRFTFTVKIEAVV